MAERYVIKLVRDRIAEVGPARGFHYAPVRNPAEHRQLLRAKLIEEAGEYLTAATDVDRFAELVDLYQVLNDLAVIDLGLPHFGRVQQAAADKAYERGRFVEGTVMVAGDGCPACGGEPCKGSGHG